MEKTFQKPELVLLDEQLFRECEIRVFILRLEKIHPVISGNKWYKLKYNLIEFANLKKKKLVTFGGAFSNHIVATAAAGKEFGIETTGIIRGEELFPDSNPALRFANACGMKLIFVTRSAYREMLHPDYLPERISELLQENPSEIYIIPEGGFNEAGARGCEEMALALPPEFDYICCACGTGTTLAGISKAIGANQQAIGIPVLRGENFIKKNIVRLNGGKKNFHIFSDYHFNGYRKMSDKLIGFCKDFNQKHGIVIEPVYTGKLFYGVYDLAAKNLFRKGSKVLVVHSGGIYSWNQLYS